MSNCFFFLLALFSLSLALGPDHPISTFVDYVNTGDIEQLKVFGGLVQDLRACTRLEFNQAVLRAAKMEFLDGLKYLAGHQCAMDMSSKYWNHVFYIALNDGNLKMLEFLFKSQLVAYSRVDLEQDIVEVCTTGHYKLIRMYLLYDPTMAGLIYNYLDAADRDYLSWLLNSADALMFLREGHNPMFYEYKLTAEVIAFILSPSSFGFSRTAIASLFAMLQRRYERSTPQERWDAFVRHDSAGSGIVSKFLLSLADGGEPDLDAFADEVLEAQKP
jgi:hypothetical protein